jgi:arylformamidase
MPRGTRLIDVSVLLRPGVPTYPGNQPFEFEPVKRIANGDSSNVSRLVMGTHSGTHVDAPKHFFDDGAAVDTLSLDTLMGPAVLICVDDSVMAVGEEQLKLHELKGHQRILIKTRNSSFIRGNEFVKDYTYLAPDGAEYLASLGVKLVGVDYFSVEQFHSGHHRTHRTLLERGIIIVEGLDLSAPPLGPYELRVLPLRLTGRDGAPARAVLVG